MPEVTRGYLSRKGDGFYGSIDSKERGGTVVSLPLYVRWRSRAKRRRGTLNSGLATGRLCAATLYVVR